MKTLSINGVDFEIKKVDAERLHEMASRVIRGYATLDDCYERYSRAKEQIYDYWTNWASYVHGLYSFGITSYNTNMFVLGGVIETPDELMVIRITKAHNIIYIAK